MEWWDIPGKDCIFAFDSTSEIAENKLKFSNNNQRFVNFYNGLNESTAGYTSGEIYENNTLKTYKSLNIKNTNLIFDTPIELPSTFTFILKCTLRTSSTFLSNSGVDYGLAFGTGDRGNSTDGYWRIKGFESGTDTPPEDVKRNMKNGLHTVILKGDLDLREVYLITDFGTYQIPESSDAFNYFLKNQTYTTLGDSHTSTYWRTNTDIIAYGLFKGILSDEQIRQVLNKVESQFYVPFDQKFKVFEEGFSTDISSLGLKSLSSPALTYITGSISREPTLKTYLNTLENVQTQNILFRNLKTISDTVLEENVPVVTTLFLHERHTGVLLKTTKSDKQGFFCFRDLDANLEYIIRASDDKYQYKSISKDYNI